MEWMHYRLKCRSCKRAGSLGIWKDKDLQWDAVWMGFKGTAQITGPELSTIECTYCYSKDIEIERKEMD